VGVGARKASVAWKHLLSWEKIQRAVTLGPTHISSLDDRIP
jgi:hypothetical protein